MADQPAQGQQMRRARMHLNDENNFMNIRDRLFHHMLVKVALAYSNTVPYFVRKIIEFFMLIMAISFLICLLFIHLMSTRQSASCLESYNATWPRDGIIRLEVVENLDMLKFKEDWIAWYKSGRSQLVCNFDPAEVLRSGPAAIPAEIRHGGGYEAPLYYHDDDEEDLEDDGETDDSHTGYFGAKWLAKFLTTYLKRNEGYPSPPKEPLQIDPNDPYFEEAESAFTQLFRHEYNQMTMPQVVYRMEYAQFYGLLRLPYSYRNRKNISTLHIRLSSEDSCFGDSLMLFAMKNVIGYEEAIMSSLRRLAINESLDDTGLGYLHNLNTNEHYHFITHGYSKGSYLTAAVLMVAFTFAISLLLRFSHHQIFVFIVEILHMFETAQPIQFPAAALLTVILALVGMEAIMSEIFSDTSTAFYVILVVWIADQFDAICCQSPTSRRYWLRFFYLYQFFFYAYQYRFGGQYGGIALLTSISFVLHSMIYFFHHYEMPQILYQERLQRMFSEIEAMPMSLPTPQYRLSAVQKSSVYEPAEDTFLLLDAIEKDIQMLRSLCPQIALEIGCGSGVVSTFLNQALEGKVMSFATDLNPHALDCTIETAKLNGVNIQVVRTDLETGLDHIKGKVDILLFNPPYVPTEKNPQNDLERCWAGGESGRGALDRLLPKIPELLSPIGVFYLVALHANNIPQLLKHSSALNGTITMERRCGIEHLYILRFTRRQ